MAVRMRKVLASPWVGVCVLLTLSLSLSIWRLKSGHECNFEKLVTRNEDTNILRLSLPFFINSCTDNFFTTPSVISNGPFPTS